MGNLLDVNLEDLQYVIYEDEDREVFKVKDLESANWCFKKLKAINDEVKEIKYLADKERQRINEWEKKELKSFQSSTDFFEMLLEDYYRELRVKDDKANLSTPYGKVSSRKQQPNFKRDELVLLEWAKQNKPEFVKVKESPDWAGLKKEIEVKDNIAVTKDGEIVEGVSVEEREDSITIKVAE